MKLLERRKATQVRKKREARRESRTILRLASLLSRRMVAGCLNGEYGGSLSSKEPMMFLCNNDKAGGRKVGSENNNETSDAKQGRTFCRSALIGKRRM